MKEKARGKGETRGQSTWRWSFNDLQNMLFLDSSLADVARKQMTVLDRLRVHICITFWVELNANKVYKFLRDGCCVYPILYLTNVAPPCDFCLPPCCEILAMRMIQIQILANSVHHPHSQISMRILSLSLFHKFVEIRACDRQRPPDVVFWLKMVSVLGFKNSCVVKKQLHNGM